MTRRIAICAPSTPFTREDAARVTALAEAEFPELELVFHDQCFASEGHFAGPDALRRAAFVQCANDPAFDAVWFVRGGYGANRIAQDVLPELGASAYDKQYLGYSDGGSLLGLLYRARIGRQVHAPMPVDLRRSGEKPPSAARSAGSAVVGTVLSLRWPVTCPRSPSIS